ncbi:MAG: small multi-drug export protein [Candidatus Methanospirareceae archaeon]
MQKLDKWVALAKFFIPFLIAGAAVVFLYLAGEEVYTDYAKVFAGYFAPFSWIPITIGLYLGIHPVALTSFITFCDALVSLFLVWNLDYAKGIPGLGRLMGRVERSGNEAIRRYKWVKRRRFMGLVLFVMIPISWTGSAVGSIVGRVIGMTPAMTWVAVVMGSSLRSILIIILIYIGVLALR